MYMVGKAVGVNIMRNCNFSLLRLDSTISCISKCRCLPVIRSEKSFSYFSHLIWSPSKNNNYRSLYTFSFVRNPLQSHKRIFNVNQRPKPFSRIFSRTNVSSTNIPIVTDPKAKKLMGYWLLTCSGMVFTTVALGGITRLTESGLSMVSWRFYGENMPRTEQQWLEEFEKYKQYPEFQIKNKDISLEDFKWIWRMEYFHRMWARCTGAVYLVPALYFLYKFKLRSRIRSRIYSMALLLLAQGLLGWYMVQSGLENRFDGPNDMPRVSQYRLAAHLTLAFILYLSLLRNALDLLSPALQWPIMNKSIVPFKILAHHSKGMVFLTAISGAFVAGLDAGLIYNSFPKMADRWIPEDLLDMTPSIKNFFENPTTVQFDHRILGTATLSFITALWLWSVKFKLPPGAKFAVNAFAVMAYTQVGLGITTLLMYVPTYLGALHQCGSLVLLSLATWLTHELKYIKRVAK